jgi:GH35 family endo-1,4-beta-xylanase
MKNNPTYTIKHEQIGDHLQVHIVELDITVETDPGKTSRDDALDLAHQAITKYHLAQRSQPEQVKAS